MATTEVPPAEGSPPSQLTPRLIEMADFLFQSFYFSQGDFGLQEQLFIYGQAHYASELDSLTVQDRVDIQELLIRRTTKWIKHGLHVSADHLDYLGVEAYGQRGKLQEIISDSVCESEDSFIRPSSKLLSTPEGCRILDLGTSAEVIVRDMRWLDAGYSRPNRLSKPMSPQQDAFLSHMVHYGLLGRNTHNVAMNAIFARLRSAVLMRLASPDTDFDGPRTDGATQSSEVLEWLGGLVTVHLEHHPDDQPEIEAILANPE